METPIDEQDQQGETGGNKQQEAEANLQKIEDLTHGEVTMNMIPAFAPRPKSPWLAKRAPHPSQLTDEKPVKRYVTALELYNEAVRIARDFLADKTLSQMKTLWLIGHLRFRMEELGPEEAEKFASDIGMSPSRMQLARDVALGFPTGKSLERLHRQSALGRRYGRGSSAYYVPETEEEREVYAARMRVWASLGLL